MRKFNLYFPTLAALVAFLLTGCYTQLETVHTERITSERDRIVLASEEEKSEQRDHARERRVAELAPDEEESYLFGYEDGIDDGYEDGWADAEAYYIDYETKDWYSSTQATIAHDKGHTTHIHNYYGYDGYYPHAWDRYHYRYTHWHIRHRYGGWDHYSPYYAWYPVSWSFGLSFHSPFAYGYYRYPPYGVYYGGYYGGYPYYGHSFGYVNYRHLRVQPERTYTARTTGLRSSGLTRAHRVRSSDASVASTRRSQGRTIEEKRSTIRNNAQVRRTGRSGSVNTTRSTNVNRGNTTTRSVDRNRGNVNRNRGNVNRNRGSGNVNRNRGNVNRNRGSGNVNRNRGNVNRNRGSGNVNRNRGSSGNTNRSRSSGRSDNQRSSLNAPADTGTNPASETSVRSRSNNSARTAVTRSRVADRNASADAPSTSVQNRIHDRAATVAPGTRTRTTLRNRIKQNVNQRPGRQLSNQRSRGLINNRTQNSNHSAVQRNRSTRSNSPAVNRRTTNRSNSAVRSNRSSSNGRSSSSSRSNSRSRGN